MGTQLLMSRIEDVNQQANHMKLRRCCVSEFLGYKKHDLIFCFLFTYSTYHSSLSFELRPYSTASFRHTKTILNRDWQC